MRIPVAVLIMLAGCAPGPDSRFAGAPPQSGAAAGRAAPLVDHHQHLLSPAAAALSSTPVLPAVEVPAGIATLLRVRAERSDDPDRLAAIFTPDALFLGFGQFSWMRGAQRAAEFVSQNFRPGYRLTPVSYERAGSTAKVSGYYTRGDGEARRYPGHFQLTLVHGTDSGWRIASEVPVFPGPAILPVFDAEALVGMLDAAGIERAIVLSNAYYFDGLLDAGGEAAVAVRAENDWTAGQVARFPNRLVGFCSFNPLAAHAFAELERCSGLSGMRGLKLHLGTSGIDLADPEQAAGLRRIFEAANRLRLPILTHLTATRDYGRRHAEIFVREVLPAAPDVPVVIAHLWGGAGYSDEALAVYAEAVESRNPAARNLYFELAQVSLVEAGSEVNLSRMAARMRQIGLDRIFYGSDGPWGSGRPPREVWLDFRARMPLSEEEFRSIAGNVAPFMR